MAQCVYHGTDSRVVSECAVVVFEPAFRSLATIDSYCMEARMITESM